MVEFSMVLFLIEGFCFFKKIKAIITATIAKTRDITIAAITPPDKPLPLLSHILKELPLVVLFASGSEIGSEFDFGIVSFFSGSVVFSKYSTNFLLA